MSEAIQYDRRRFIETAVMATASAGLVGSRWREPLPRDESSLTTTDTHRNRSPGPTRQRVGYAEAGPTNGPPAILLHGWPHGINSDVGIAPLAVMGYRVIVPRPRGFGTKRLVSSDTMRNGEQALVASDVMALMDALKIEKALVGGFDGSAVTADIMAALWPQRVKAIVPISGNVVVNLAANQRALPPKEELEWWYKYYFVRD
jgi:pimeloyl-ACP methyl ester carboxylesterase